MADFNQLLAGYRRFRETGWAHERERWSALAEGQAPRTMVIACSDSRVDPGQIFDASPGEMFVVRNVAALVPPYETGGGYHGVSAALEFAVGQLKVAEIIVMGHGGCGGCGAALTDQFDGAPDGEGGFIDRWISMLAEAREKVLIDYGGDLDAHATRAMEHEAVKVSLANLRGFPWVRDGEAAGALKLHGAYFAIADGGLQLLDETSGLFASAPQAGDPLAFRPTTPES